METPGIGNNSFSIKIYEDFYCKASSLSTNVENKKVGILRFIDSDTPNLFIKRLYVNKKFRRKGYGKSLISTCVNIALENSCESISLYVSMDNPDAIEFYRSCDFFISNILKKKRYYLMTKRL